MVNSFLDQMLIEVNLPLESMRPQPSRLCKLPKIQSLKD